MKHSDTLLLMKIIGEPNTTRSDNFPQDLNEDILLRIFSLAVKNKIPLLFFEHIPDKYMRSKSLQNLYKIYSEKHRLSMDLIIEIENIFNQSQINYLIFKTFRPFRSVTADVDILFFNYKDLKQAYQALLREGYTLSGFGAFSITMYSSRHDINIDLQLEVSVLRLVYLKKQFLQESTIKINVNGKEIPSLGLPGTLAVDLSHSLYKEQMLNLSDYYKTVIEISNMTDLQRKNLVNLVEQAHVEFSVKAGLKLIDRISTVALKKNMPAITETEKMIPVSELEEKVIQFLLNHFTQKFILPYKYHPLAVSTAFISKAFTDPVMRSALVSQFAGIFSNAPYLFNTILFHIRRDTY